jgi:hypothetical protein
VLKVLIRRASLYRLTHAIFCYSDVSFSSCQHLSTALNRHNRYRLYFCTFALYTSSYTRRVKCVCCAWFINCKIFAVSPPVDMVALKKMADWILPYFHTLDISCICTVIHSNTAAFVTDRGHQKQYLGADLGTGLSRGTQIVASNIDEFLVWNGIFCHPSGARNFCMISTFLENVWTLEYIFSLLNIFSRCEHVLAYVSYIYLFFHAITHCWDAVLLLCPKTAYLILKLLEVQVEWNTQMS